MNLFAMLNRGAAHAPAPKIPKPHIKAAEAARKQWLNALLVDQTRAWMSLGESEPELLSAMAAMLTIAGFAHVFDAKSADTADLRIIRGAISAAEQCSLSGSVMTLAHVQAFRSACDRAQRIIEGATVPAIIHAATSIRNTVGIQ